MNDNEDSKGTDKNNDQPTESSGDFAPFISLIRNLTKKDPNTGHPTWLQLLLLALGIIKFQSKTIIALENGFKVEIYVTVIPSSSDEFLYTEPTCKLYNGETLIVEQIMEQEGPLYINLWKTTFEGVFPRPTVAEIVAEFMDAESSVADTVSHLELL